MRETYARVPKRHRTVLVAERGREWSRALPEALIVVILALLYRGIVRDLALQWWDDPNYSHGFLVPFFSGYLIWHQRHELQAQAPRGTVLGLAVLVAGILELLLGDLGVGRCHRPICSRAKTSGLVNGQELARLGQRGRRHKLHDTNCKS